MGAPLCALAAMIIGVLNRKGGVGKTTIAINVAATLAVAGVRVLLVDADPQASALSWSSLRERDPLFAVVGMARPTLHREIPEIAAKFDVVVIDGGPGVNDLGRAAILASDLVLIPVQPSPYDVWAAAETVQQIREARRFKKGLKAAFIVNRKIAYRPTGGGHVGAVRGPAGACDRPQPARHLRGKRCAWARRDRGRA
jgi:chromosome partitioning protein